MRSGAPAPPIQPARGGCRLRVRVRPGAPEDAIQGLHGEALRIAVREAPEKGKANRALCVLLARVLDVPASRIEVVSGASAHDKTIHVEGLDAESCRARLAPWLSPPGAAANAGATDSERQKRRPRRP